MAILNNNPLIGSGGNQGYNINNSVRLRQSASAYFNRTFGSTYTDKTKSTVSFWVKRGVINYTNGQTVMWYNASGASGNFTFAGGGAGGSLVNDCFVISNRNATTGASDYTLQTTQLFRDPSAWYHIMVVYDTGQATSSNRIKIYVNGNQVTAFTTATYPSQNYQTTAFLGGNSAAHIIGYGAIAGPTEYFDGYLADFNFIDGSAKTPSDFGETDTITGVWKPKAYSGTYGTNGFYLKFSDIATTSGSNAGLGKDFSGNSNYWTTNNISVTSGTTYDAMTDSPTNTSATVANYPVMTPAYLPRGSYTLSEANLKCSAAYASSNYPRIMSSMGMTSGKYYWEYVGVTFPSTESCSIGIKEVSSAYPSATGGLGAVSGEIGLFNTGRLDNNGSTTSSFSTSFTTGDVIGMAFDATNGTLNYYKNGSAIGSQITGITAGTYAPAFDSLSTSQTVWNVNYGQRPFAYTPPSGFVALNTFNLPTPTILQGNKYMDATLYSGNDASSRLITNNYGFKPDLVWIKARNDIYNHYLNDSVRGAGLTLFSNLTNSEDSGSSTSFNSFNSNGFTVSQVAGWEFNKSTKTYVGWQWQAGQGSTSNITVNQYGSTPSIASTVSVNTTAGFSIVTYAGNSTSSATVGHGLGVSPSMVIIKNRSSVTNWVVRHSSLSSTQNVSLNTTDAAYTVSSGTANGGVGAFTSTTFGFISGTTGLLASNQTSNNYVAYCWAEIAGFSSFGSYTGNGSADGTFVYTGFRPKFVVIKVSSTTNSWEIFDTSRDTYNASGLRLFAESTSAEVDSRPYIDILSNGFKLRSTGTGINGSSSTYIFMAFAENPFKNALAR